MASSQRRTTKKKPAKKEKKESIFVGELSVQQVIDAVTFEDEEVEHAARTLPKLMLEAVKLRVRAMRRRMQNGQQLDVARVEAAHAVRAAAKESGDKVTEAAIKELAEMDPDVKKLQSDMLKYIELEELYKLLLECYRYKKAAIGVVADMTNAEAAMTRYFERDDAQGKLSNLRKKAQDQYDNLEDD